MSAAGALPLRDIHDLTANYSDRQGLRIVPMALAVMMQAFPQYIPRSIFGFDIVLVAMAIALGGYFLIGRYYRNRFGAVEEIADDKTILFFGSLVLIMFALIIAFMVDVAANPPVFVSGLLVAAWLIATAWPSRQIRGQYLAIGLVLALVSLAPLVGEPLPSVGRIYGFVFGSMLLLAGVRDHLAFVRFFAAAEQQHG
jgi:hypothetical protein